jgi:peptidylprolyl isomerase
VTVKGDFGAEPTVTIASPTKVQKASVDDLIVGTGTPITAKNQPIVVDIALYDARTGQKIGATGFDKTTAASDVNSLASQAKPLGDALQCATAGSRLLVGFPAGTAAEDAAVAVLDVRAVFLPHAEGSLGTTTPWACPRSSARPTDALASSSLTPRSPPSRSSRPSSTAMGPR